LVLFFKKNASLNLSSGAPMRRFVKYLLVGVAGLVVLSVAAAVFIYIRTKPAPNPPFAAADYTNTANWVCLPGRNDSCSTDIDATAIAADGSTSKITPVRDPDPKVDCFYVYPTVSRDRTQNARLAMAPEIDLVTRAQFARFSTVCRPYAPLYRQSTLQSLKAAVLGIAPFGDLDLAYGDVRDAWKTYLAKYNQGRGVILIGHSQGSRMLKRLAQEEIEGKPAQSQLISVMLTGNEVKVLAGQDTGGDFKILKLCRAPDQTGCVIAYSSFRASAPPPPDSRYGHDPGHGMNVACTNPAALAGSRAVLDSYFLTRNDPARPYAGKPISIDTPFVTLPGLVSGECVHDAHGTYLAITLNGQPTDARRNDIDGDLVVFGRVRPEWGLHLVDMNLPQGDLVKLVQSQSAAFSKAH
jgi:hypothetical protein